MGLENHATFILQHYSSGKYTQIYIYGKPIKYLPIDFDQRHTLDLKQWTDCFNDRGHKYKLPLAKTLTLYVF